MHRPAGSPDGKCGSSVGRETKLTPEVQAKVIEAIEAGMFFDRAAEYAGISEGTFWRWMQKGSEEPGPDDVDIRNLPIGTLRKLAKANDIVLPRPCKLDQAAQILTDAGISPWALYAQFREAVTRADVEAELYVVTQWRLHMADNHKAIVDFVARRYAKRWADPTRKLEISGADGAPLVSREDRAERMAVWLEGFKAGARSVDPAAALSPGPVDGVVDVASRTA